MFSNRKLAARRAARAARVKSVASGPNPQSGTVVGRAVRAVVEPLEGRRLMAGDASLVRALPYALEFDETRTGGVVDRDNEGTGFSWVQSSPKLGTEYRPDLLDLRTGDGVLRLTSSGTKSTGSNWEGDNTLPNVLQTQFDATAAGGFTISTRINGPFTALAKPGAQGGLIFGPDQDRYVKLAVITQMDGQRVLQFVDERKTATGYAHAPSPAASYVNVGNLNNVASLDLILAGDYATGKLTAYYRINHGALKKLPLEITQSGTNKTSLFNAASRAGIYVLNKVDGAPVTLPFDRFEIVRGLPAGNQPTVIGTNPASGATGVARDQAIDADVRLPVSGIDRDSLSTSTVKLYRTRDKAPVAGSVTTTGGRDSINFDPTGTLAANTSYTLEITSGVRDVSGNAFKPFKMSFTTGTAVVPTSKDYAFSKVTLSGTTGKQFTGVTMGPDGKLYAGTRSGLIYRFTLKTDGSVAATQVINTVQAKNGGPRLLTGIRFDPASTASNLVLWVTHGAYLHAADDTAADWTGKVSRLSGTNLSTYQDYVTRLPRSVRDHLTNQVDFGADGALYFSQASNSAMGAPDAPWGNRPERLLNAAILRLDTKAVAARIAAGKGPVDAKTQDGGTYNPFANGAPLTIYATGVRNAYDLLWHSNGKLYVPTNGSAAGGNTPASSRTGQRIDNALKPYAGPTVKGVSGVGQTMDDYLFRVEKGGYYGHPNPLRGEFVLNGGNPTSGADDFEVTSYPVGTKPDANYRGAAHSFGRKQSANGVIEYRSNAAGSAKAFGGKLEGKLMVAQFSTGNDIVILELDAAGDVVPKPATRVEGLTGFNDPLDLAVDKRTGFIYVTEYAETEPGKAKITLLRPKTPGA